MTQITQNSKEILLQLFRDNNSQFITASSMRKFVEAVYNEMLLLENVIDSSDVFETNKVATINQTSQIKSLLDDALQRLQTLEDKASKETYTKQEVDAYFYKKDYIDDEIYTKAQVFNRNEIVGMVYTKDQVDAKLDEINRRIDNIIRKNNLSE
jgi:hypothetical protein